MAALAHPVPSPPPPLLPLSPLFPPSFSTHRSSYPLPSTHVLRHHATTSVARGASNRCSFIFLFMGLVIAISHAFACFQHQTLKLNLGLSLFPPIDSTSETLTSQRWNLGVSSMEYGRLKPIILTATSRHAKNWRNQVRFQNIIHTFLQICSILFYGVSVLACLDGFIDGVYLYPGNLVYTRQLYEHSLLYPPFLMDNINLVYTRDQRAAYTSQLGKFFLIFYLCLTNPISLSHIVFILLPRLFLSSLKNQRLGLLIFYRTPFLLFTLFKCSFTPLSVLVNKADRSKWKPHCSYLWYVDSTQVMKVDYLMVKSLSNLTKAKFSWSSIFLFVFLASIIWPMRYKKLKCSISRAGYLHCILNAFICTAYIFPYSTVSSLDAYMILSFCHCLSKCFFNFVMHPIFRGSSVMYSFAFFGFLLYVGSSIWSFESYLNMNTIYCFSFVMLTISTSRWTIYFYSIFLVLWTYLFCLCYDLLKISSWWWKLNFYPGLFSIIVSAYLLIDIGFTCSCCTIMILFPILFFYLFRNGTISFNLYGLRIKYYFHLYNYLSVSSIHLALVSIYKWHARRELLQGILYFSSVTGTNGKWKKSVNLIKMLAMVKLLLVKTNACFRKLGKTILEFYFNSTLDLYLPLINKVSQILLMSKMYRRIGMLNLIITNLPWNSYLLINILSAPPAFEVNPDRPKVKAQHSYFGMAGLNSRSVGSIFKAPLKIMKSMCGLIYIKFCLYKTAPIVHLVPAPWTKWILKFMYYYSLIGYVLIDFWKVVGLILCYKFFSPLQFIVLNCLLGYNKSWFHDL